MAVVSVTRRWSGRVAGDDDTDARTLAERWMVLTDNPDEPVSSIRNAAGLPARNSAHPQDAELVVVDRSFRQHEDNARLWEVDIQYDSAGEEEENPLLRPVKVGPWRSAQYTRAPQKDLDGEPMTSSSGDPFDPPFEVEDPRWTVRIQKNVFPFPSWLLVDDYRNAKNSASFFIAGIEVAVGGARLFDIEIGELEEENGVSFYSLSYNLEFRERRPAEGDEEPGDVPEAWDYELLDMGVHELTDDEPRKRVPILTDETEDQEPEPVAMPVKLDGEGHVLSDGEDPVYLLRKFHPSKPFASLPGLDELQP